MKPILTQPKKKTVYVLCIRYTDREPWGDPTYYRKKKDRDCDEKHNRILGGIRTHSFKEKKTEAEIADLCD